MDQRIAQTGADRGARSGKSGQSKHFIGYKKHNVCGLIRVGERFVRLPLCSLARPASVTDVEMLEPLLQAVHQELAGLWPLRLVILDKGYIQGELAGQWRRDHQVALVIAPKKDMKPPCGCDERGCPLCPLGEALVWEDYVAEDGGRLIYRGQPERCRVCPLAGSKTICLGPYIEHTAELMSP